MLPPVTQLCPLMLVLPPPPVLVVVLVVRPTEKALIEPLLLWLRLPELLLL